MVIRFVGRFCETPISVPGGRYTYKVCEAGTQNCSNEVTVRFGGGGKGALQARDHRSVVAGIPDFS